MTKKKSNKISELKEWIAFNKTIIGCVLSVLILFVLYYTITTSYRSIELNDYTESVNILNIEYDRINFLPGIYSTEQKLDKIVFEIDYEYDGEKYESISNMYWEYVNPSLERILDSNELDKLQVKCKKGQPEDVMVFIDE